MDDDIRIAKGSGNVYADLGRSDADDALNKARLAHRISSIIRERGWSQSGAAREMGIDQPKLSAIVRGNLRDFSLIRLAGYLNRLGEDVEIRTRPNLDPTRSARIVVIGDEPAAGVSSVNAGADAAGFD